MLARDLARRGRELNLFMKEKHRQAASDIFASRNPGDQVRCSVGVFYLSTTELPWGQPCHGLLQSVVFGSRANLGRAVHVCHASQTFGKY